MTIDDAHGTKERPIIQVSLRDFKNRKQEIARDLWKAATEIGFFYLCDTGISEASGPTFLTRYNAFCARSADFECL